MLKDLLALCKSRLVFVPSGNKPFITLINVDLVLRCYIDISGGNGLKVKKKNFQEQNYSSHDDVHYKQTETKIWNFSYYHDILLCLYNLYSSNHITCTSGIPIKDVILPVWEFLFKKIRWSHNSFILTHWGQVTHICISKLNIIGSDNGLSPDQCQAIIWTNAGILLTGYLGTKFSEISIEIHIFSFMKMHFKKSFGKWQPFCLCLNVLI